MSKTLKVVDFSVPENADDLPQYVGVSKNLFHEVISSGTRREFYPSHEIPKKSSHRKNQFRVVWNVRNSRLAEAHKTFVRRFELFAREADPRFPHAAAYGYVRKRGTLDNAAVHCGAPLLMRADIHNFFPSISVERLVAKFIALGMKRPAADALAKFVTIDGSLPLGLNGSPMLANLVCVEMDEKIQALAAQSECKYTRYADDISISGKTKLPRREELEKILEEEGFKLSREKFRVTKLGQAHYVTGLSVSDAVPHAPRRIKKRLRQELHYCDRFGIRDHLRHRGEDITAGVNRIDGTVRYVSHKEAAIGPQLKALWSKILRRDAVEPSYAPRESRAIQSVSCFVDETEIRFNDKKFLALGLVFTNDSLLFADKTEAVLRAHTISDAFAAGDKDALKKKGLHFTDSHPDLRTAYVKLLENLSFRAFVIFAQLKSDDEYTGTYITLLKRILPQRLVWYDRADITMIFEENSKIRRPAIVSAVSTIYKKLERANNRRPINSPVVVVGKKLEYPQFSVPDFVLAIFSRYAQFGEKPEEIRKLQFERLRDKYRLIVDADSGEEFSRRHPFVPWMIQRK
jgi:RNA-directed DNA polymerase